MTEITLSDVSSEQLLQLGDAALTTGDARLAFKLYAAALPKTKGFLWLRLRLRVGIARNANNRTLTSLAVLRAIDDTGFIFVGEGLATWNKTLPFMEDKRFLDLVEKHADLAPLPNWHWNLHTVLWAINQARTIPGDFVELGVFKGHTTSFLADYVDFAQWKQRWYLYDTFEGIPDDQLDEGWAEINQSTYKDTFSFDAVRDLFGQYDNIDVIKGRVPEILQQKCPDKISFIHLDLNNTAAEIGALNYLYDRISPGGVIVLDDYGWAASRQQHLAENAWFAERGLQILALPTGQGLFVKPGV